MSDVKPGGVAAMGQSLRQRAGRLSAERETSLRSTAGTREPAEGVVGERTRRVSPAGVMAGEKAGPQRRPRALSGTTTPGVVAQDSPGCSMTGVRSIDLERRRWINLRRFIPPPVCLMCDRDVMW